MEYKRLLGFCPICDLKLKPHFPEFLYCPHCYSLYRIPTVKRWTAKEYWELYGNRSQLQNELDTDFLHYKRLTDFTYLYERDEVFRGKELTTIYSYGGGFPKCESIIFKSKKIIVYDFIIDFYKNNPLLKYFQEKFQPPEIEWREEIPESLVLQNDELLTAVHFLEHQEVEEMINLLNGIKGKIFIYQPNPLTAHSSDWFHFSPDHFSLLSPDAMSRLLKNAGFQILTQKSYAFDFYILAQGGKK